MKVTVEGRKKLAAKLAKVPRNVEDRVNRAVAEVGEDLLSKAIPVTPLEFGPLRQSGYVDHSVPGMAVVGFSEPYSVYVHEMPPTNRFTTPGTGPKFLTGPFLLERGRYADHIKDAARRGLNG